MLFSDFVVLTPFSLTSKGYNKARNGVPKLKVYSYFLLA